jgi:hypothetical protein
LPDALLDALFFPAQEARHHCYILKDGVMGKKADVLDHIAHLATGRDRVGLVEVFPIEQYLSLSGFYQAIEHFEGGRFSTAAGPYQGQGLPRFQSKAQPLHGTGRAVMLTEVDDFDHGKRGINA